MRISVAAAFAAILFQIAAPARAGTVLSLSTPDPAASSITIAANNLADLVKKATGGEIVIEVHPDGELFAGDPGRAIRMLASGSLDMLFLSASLYANQKPRFIAISIPYLFDDADQFRNYLAGEAGETLAGDIQSLGIHPLGLWPRPFRVVTNSKHPVGAPADYRGLRLRVPNNPLWVEFFRALGAAPTPIPFGEVYRALKDHVVDGQENPLSIVMDAKFYEVQKYLSCTEHIADAWVLGINGEKWDKLPESAKKAIDDAAAQAREVKARHDAGGLDQIKTFLAAKGMEIRTLAPEEKAAFAHEAKKLYPRFGELTKDPEFFRKTLRFVGKE